MAHRVRSTVPYRLGDRPGRRAVWSNTIGNSTVSSPCHGKPAAGCRACRRLSSPVWRGSGARRPNVRRAALSDVTYFVASRKINERDHHATLGFRIPHFLRENVLLCRWTGLWSGDKRLDKADNGRWKKTPRERFTFKFCPVLCHYFVLQGR